MKKEAHIPSLSRKDARQPWSFVIYEYGSDAVFTKIPFTSRWGVNYGKKLDTANRRIVVGSGATVKFSFKTQPRIILKDYTSTERRIVEEHGEVCLPGGAKITLPPETWVTLPDRLGIKAMYTRTNPYPLNI